MGKNQRAIYKADTWHGVWRGGVSLLGVVFTGVGFVGARSPLVMVEWKVMRAR